MTDMVTRPKWILALFLVLLTSASCLPEIHSVAERRAKFPRANLKGKILVDKPPADMVAANVVFDSSIKLLGYTMVPAKPKPGTTVKVTYYWTPLKLTAENFLIFIHGDGVDRKQSRIHGDHYPARGAYPTDVWRIGDIIADEMNITIPMGYGARHLGLFSGLYIGKRRLTITSAGSRPKTSDNRSRVVDIYL